MGGIEDIIEGERFEQNCAELHQAAHWLRNQTGLPLDTAYQWFDLLDSDPQLCIEQVIKYMQQSETDRQQCSPA